ncbi:unnamed protein product [Caenorhabditis bovis]|uniref:Uncharacterized protein n=1 Tax=Caenorhabditis bovis TaxID=2654633 RepID=A0A8S1F375_9PELO|nr:unnamed protein product [Caenorhabditis bovis]
MVNEFLNYATFPYFITLFVSFLIEFSLKNRYLKVFPLLICFCHKKKDKKTPEVVKLSGEDETQVDHVGQLADDFLANVHLLTPTLPGGCTDDNAAKEAMMRHRTNQYFPQLEIQKEMILNKTTSSELHALLDKLPPHPPQRFRAKIDKNIEKIAREREEKYKNLHVSWHNVGLVYIVRGSDPARAKDDGVSDTIDSPSGKENDAANDGNGENLNSEIPMTGQTPARTPAKEKTESMKKKDAKATKSKKKIERTATATTFDKEDTKEKEKEKDEKEKEKEEKRNRKRNKEMQKPTVSQHTTQEEEPSNHKDKDGPTPLASKTPASNKVSRHDEPEPLVASTALNLPN